MQIFTFDYLPTYAVIVYVIISAATAAHLLKEFLPHRHIKKTYVLFQLGSSGFLGLFCLLVYWLVTPHVPSSPSAFAFLIPFVVAFFFIALYAAQIALGWWMIKPITKK